MEKVLGDLLRNEVRVYIDDIMMATATMDRHFVVLNEVFANLRHSNLKLKPTKCRLFRSEIEYLGYVVTAEGVKTDPKKIEKINSFPRPITLKQWRSFLGQAGYYRKFVQNFGQIAAPLYNIVKTQKPFGWSDDCQNAFEAIKQHLTTVSGVSTTGYCSCNKLRETIYNQY